MSSEEPKDNFNRFAKIITIVFHPLFMPLYGMIIIFAAPTLLGYLPFNIMKLLFLIILVNNVLLPISLLPFFVHHHIISSYSINERKERNIPPVSYTHLRAHET